MKFLTKINRNFLLQLTIILVVVSIAAYFILQTVILNDTKESLVEKEQLILKQIEETGEIPNIFPIVEVKRIIKKTIENPIYKGIYIRDDFDKELEPFIEYSNETKINGEFYSIKIRQSTFENSDLVIIITLCLIILLLSAFGVTYFISKKINKTIWSDFEKNLLEIENFNFNKNENLELLNSNVEEFDRLNKVVQNLTNKLKTDYQSLKEFTENASHEIQTPLSIALLNLEELLQQHQTEDSFKQIASTINAINRLSSLNHSLILLTKIENRQFNSEHESIINTVINQKLLDFSTLFETKKLKVQLDDKGDFILKINPQLVEILINNLLSNAVNHNITNGSIHILINENELKICNSGTDNSLTNKTIFNRFAKDKSESYGLGLAIVKKICDTHNLEICYIKDEFHCMKIKKYLELFSS